MPTAAQRNAVRWDLGASLTDLPDATIDGLYARSETTAYDGMDAAQDAVVKLLVLRNLKAQAAKRTDYKQNQSQEWLSQLLPNLERLEKQFKDDLDAALSGAYGSVRMGLRKRSTPRWVDFPDNYPIENLVAPDENADISKLLP